MVNSLSSGKQTELVCQSTLFIDASEKVHTLYAICMYVYMHAINI